jgi:hypothetical protein
MRSRLALPFLLAATLGSCFAGPHQLGRSVDDWDHSLYVQSPWLDASLWFVPVFPVTKLVAMVSDFFVTDAVAFWFGDAWDCAGTGYEWLPVEPTDGYVESLLRPRARWISVWR